MNTPKKTVPALKIQASWTPIGEIAERMMRAALAGTGAEGARYTSGRLGVAHAIKADFADPAQASRVATRAAEVKAALAATGTLHDFRTSAGRVLPEHAEELADVDAHEPRDEDVAAQGAV
jgi:hypothetical protein